MNLTPVREIARGRWRSILPEFGIDPKALTGKQVPCPLCGGKDRFRCDDKEGRGSWICNHCGAGDGIQLVMAKTGLAFRDAAKRVEEIAGHAPVVQPKPERTDKQHHDAIERMWRASQPVTAGDPVDTYLRARLGDIVVPPTIRFATRCFYQDDEPSWHPAMISRVTGPDGKTICLHRTYLTLDGRKADVPFPRRNMPGHLPDGIAVRLMARAPTMGVAEGIETAFAASKLFGIPVWSTLNEGMLAKWQPPEGVTDVVVFADNDVTCVGQQAGYTLARRLCNTHFSARVEVPPKPARTGTMSCRSRPLERPGSRLRGRAPRSVRYAWTDQADSRCCAADPGDRRGDDTSAA